MIVTQRATSAESLCADMPLSTERIAEYREQARANPQALAIQSVTLMLIDSLRPSYADVYRALLICEPETSEYIAGIISKPVNHVSTALDYCRRIGLVRVERVLIDTRGKHNVWRLDKGLDEQ